MSDKLFETVTGFQVTLYAVLQIYLNPAHRSYMAPTFMSLTARVFIIRR